MVVGSTQGAQFDSTVWPVSKHSVRAPTSTTAVQDGLVLRPGLAGAVTTGAAGGVLSKT